MKKGFTLVETIMYISLLSILILGVFSSIMFTVDSMGKNGDFTESNYNILIQNFYE